MKEHQNKRMKTSIIFIVLILGSAFILIINFIPTFIIKAGLTAEFTDALDSDYSAYVNQSDPNMNYYDIYGSRLIGNSCETYLHFDLGLLPKEDGRLYFSIYYYDFFDYMGVHPDYYPFVDSVEINIILIEESWSSSNVTWNNKPEHGEIINTVNISDIVQGPFIEYYNLQNAVDLTGFFDMSVLGELSLCINITKDNEQLNNRTVYISPRLLWNYDRVILSYTNIISTSIIISMLIGIIYFFRKDIYRCPNCGARNVHNEITCYSCKTTFDGALRIKKSDYQLVLSLSWIFIFFEGFYLLIASLFQFIYILSILIFFFTIPWIILCYKMIKKRIRLYKKVKQ